MAQGETEEAAGQALQIVSRAVNGQVKCSRQKPPFPGGATTVEWRLTWEDGRRRGRLLATMVQLDGDHTDSTWISFEDGTLDAAAWLRIASKALEDNCLGARIPHRQGSFGNPVLDSAFVQGLPPTSTELAEAYGPLSGERDIATPMRATDALLARVRGALAEALPRLQALGDFVIEIQDGTLSVRYPRVFAQAEAYQTLVDCARRILDAGGAGK